MSMSGGIAESAIRREYVGAVHLVDSEVREPGEQPRYISAGRLFFNGNRDGVFIVFNQKYDTQPLQAGCVERLPKLALAGGTFARADQRELVGFWRKIAAGLRASNTLHELG